MSVADMVHDLWLLSCLDRRRLRYYSLSREDQAKVSFDHDTRARLLAAIEDMPARLVERVLDEARNW
jgi:hypothetical protein